MNRSKQCQDHYQNKVKKFQWEKYAFVVIVSAKIGRTEKLETHIYLFGLRLTSTLRVFLFSVNLGQFVFDWISPDSWKIAQATINKINKQTKRPGQKFFILYMEMSPLPVKGCKIWVYARHSGPLSRQRSLLCHGTLVLMNSDIWWIGNALQEPVLQNNLRLRTHFQLIIKFYNINYSVWIF